MEKSLPLLVVGGPSGVGKGTLLGMLRKEFPKLVSYSISHTTRSPREGEIDGVDYHFVSDQKFQEMIGEIGFLEYASVHGSYYGTSWKALDTIVKNQGSIPLLEIDIQGAKQVQQNLLSDRAKFIFIMPPNFEELKNRLLKRATEDPEKIQRRLGTAKKELENYQEVKWNSVLINDDLEKSYEELKNLVKEWFVAS
eukprot:GHVP01052841.1.p1 GENE.GHVP01052841.1~~GHVP01052841.1.p1  ORF type:complete len:196 (+),score=48.53 GHVP01052841.1:442-1029(+)